ncbi:hypothetical protein DL766_005968 [Monosporascus sp. MC13-8B]|uniref:Protein kinase domain-containing protein n=1 Tax=Monosporascus cannonballus TaxID=155416 RepID=A0ABY0H7W4_9PEZI|nr:hypothetical protein DL762_004760 [Monosporascus cannonballus]RYO95712.1 hypothetical protein DL763_003603 [Monosporascus cannonballus]RYP28262.1 hypothetical protein DL766_005968 [Monosporascus sp. MC13-8B]
MDAVPEDTMPPPPAWSVLEFTFSNRNTNSELMVMCNHRRFIIRLFADNFSQSPLLKSRYLFFLEVAEKFEKDGYTVEDFYDWIVEPLLPVFRELPENVAGSTLQEFLFPETHVYTLRADGERVAAIPYDEKETMAPVFGVYLPNNICTPSPSFEPWEVQVCKESRVSGPPSNTPAKVLLKDGTIAFLKLIRPGDKHFLLNEIDKYRKMHDAHLDKSLRTPRLLGLVRDGHGQVFGLLLTYIDCGRKTLFCAVKPETPKHLRQRWATQIHDIANQLHDAGIVWGDAKPDNILIDHNNDAWLIDFGGGYTDGWVPKELAGSVEGDLKALGKITEFIGI